MILADTDTPTWIYLAEGLDGDMLVCIVYVENPGVNFHQRLIFQPSTPRAGRSRKPASAGSST